MIDISTLIQQAIGGDIKRDDAYSYCKANNTDISALWNSMALFIAKAFHKCEMNYEDADRAMNSIWLQIVVDMEALGNDYEFPELAYSIYCAFDEGEFDHGDGDDPVEKYTKPTIEKIIKKTK